VLFLEQGGFPIYIARSGIADLARTVNIATPQDLLLAMEVVGQSPYIARAMGEAQIKGIATAAIVASASLASARFADVVLAAQAHPSIGVGIVSIEAIVHALAQVLRWRFADRFAGTEQAISELSERIQQPID
jgi:DNA-binding MurR/RpiR family transcriptional regulator